MNQHTPPGSETRRAISSSAPHPFIKWFSDITIADIPLVGGKNASLGEMVRERADDVSPLAESIAQSYRPEPVVRSQVE